MKDQINELMRVEKNTFSGPKVKEDEKIIFPPNFWEDLANIFKILKPFRDITRQISMEKVTTASKIIPMMIYLTEHQYETTPEDVNNLSQIGYFLKTAIHRNLMDRFFSEHRTGNRKQNFLQNNKALNIALLMDPRMKDRCLLDKLAWKRSAKSMVLKELEGVIKDMNEKQQLEEQAIITNFQTEGTEEQTEEIESDWMSVLTPKNNQHINSNVHELEAELSAYLASNILPMSTSVMTWWEGAGRYDYPHLYYLAKKYGVIMSTSVPAERLFSNAGKILNNLRQRLDPGKVHDIAFIQGNLDDEDANDDAITKDDAIEFIQENLDEEDLMYEYV